MRGAKHNKFVRLMYKKKMEDKSLCMRVLSVRLFKSIQATLFLFVKKENRKR